jgi:predicted dinucleotide-binding enzyme
MKLTIVGTGNIGGTLGRRWAARHDVLFATRRTPAEDPELASLLAAAGPRAASAPLATAFADAEVVLLATPWSAVREVLAAAGALAGKIVIDATNPVGPGLTHALPTGSGAATVAALVPAARVVKAFNTAGFEVYADPDFGGEAASLFLCGDDAGARRVVGELAAELGLAPVDCGGLAQARRLEELALLWISLAVGGAGRGHAFRLLSR